MINKKLVNILKYIAFFLLGVILVWLSINHLRSDEKEWNKFLTALSTANYWLMLPVFLILSGSHLIRALRWKILMEPMGYKTSLPNTFFAVMIGYMANMAVPRLGEVLKCTVLAKYEKVPAEKIIGTIVAERAFDVICLGLVFIAALVVQFDVVLAAYKEMQIFIAGKPEEAMSQTRKYLLIAISILIIIGLVYSFMSGKIKKIIAAVTKVVKGVLEGLLTARKLKQKKLFIFYSIFIWVLYLLGTWIGFYATAGTANLGLEAALSALAFASIGMIITPGGIGAYAALLAIVLTLQNPPVENAIGYANGTLQWFAQCIIVLVVGFICLIILPLYNKRYTPQQNDNQ